MSEEENRSVDAVPETQTAPVEAVVISPEELKAKKEEFKALKEAYKAQKEERKNLTVEQLKTRDAVLERNMAVIKALQEAIFAYKKLGKGAKFESDVLSKLEGIMNEAKEEGL